MYRTPGRSSQGRSSRGGSPQSQFRQFRGSVPDGQDRLIKTLRKELGSLRFSSQGLSEATSHLANLQHKYTIIHGEKSRDDEIHRKKLNDQDSDVSRIADELKQLSESIAKRDYEIHDIRNAFHKLDQEVSSRNELRNNAQRQLDLEFEQYQILLEEKSQLDHSQGLIQREHTDTFANSDNKNRELEFIRDQLTKHKRLIKENRATLGEIRAENSELQNRFYTIEEDLKNSLISQKTKEGTLRRLTEKANLIESDIGLLDGEKERLREGIYVKNETIKSLSSVKMDLLRREAALSSEKETVDKLIDDTEKDVSLKRAALGELENEHLSSQSELKNLRLVYERLAGDNQKLVQALKEITDQDTKSIRELERMERIDSIINDAHRELGQAISIVRD